MQHTPKIGAYVLESLTTGMYTDPLDSLREYIQNACDSIRTAERFKIISRNEGRVVVSVNQKERTLSIRDNGTGIPSGEVVSRLLNVGMSEKLFGEEAGFRGIGRLAGIAYCDRLEFVTSYSNEGETSSISFDCVGIRSAISPAKRQVEELADVLQRHSNQDVSDSPRKEHFCEVRMIGISAAMDRFLDLGELQLYLSQVAPVEFDTHRFIFAPKIDAWARKYGVEPPRITLVLESGSFQRQVLKTYKTHYKTKQKNEDVRVCDVEFFPPELTKDSTFWLWYGKNDLLGILDDPAAAGLRFRVKNIAIGDGRTVEHLYPGKEGRLNAWTIGEIHFLHPEVVPNARRDGFEDTSVWAEVRKELSPFFKQHCKACHDFSKVSNRTTVQTVEAAEATAETVKKALKQGLTSKSEKDDLASRLDREIDHVKQWLKTNHVSEDEQKVKPVLTSMESVRKNLEEAKDGYTASKFRTNLDRKQRKVLADVLELVDETLRDNGCGKRKICLDAIKAAIRAKYQGGE